MAGLGHWLGCGHPFLLLHSLSSSPICPSPQPWEEGRARVITPLPLQANRGPARVCELLRVTQPSGLCTPSTISLPDALPGRTGQGVFDLWWPHWNSEGQKKVVLYPSTQIILAAFLLVLKASPSLDMEGSHVPLVPLGTLTWASPHP